jgi:hypothetical protein
VPVNYYCPYCKQQVPAEQTREVEWHTCDFVRFVGCEVAALPQHIRRVRLRMHTRRVLQRAYNYDPHGQNTIGGSYWTRITCGPVRRTAS